MDIYDRMKARGIQLPPAPKKGGIYSPVRHFGENMVYVSGCGPVVDQPVVGRLGDDMDIAAGQACAAACMLNVLAALEADLGDLRRVKSAVKLLTFVQSTPDFHDQPAVANGGSQLLQDLLGVEAGTPARSAVGLCALPGNIPVETEAMFEITAE